jgi:hypothetical protein
VIAGWLCGVDVSSILRDGGVSSAVPCFDVTVPPAWVVDGSPEVVPTWAEVEVDVDVDLRLLLVVDGAVVVLVPVEVVTLGTTLVVPTAGGDTATGTNVAPGGSTTSGAGAGCVAPKGNAANGVGGGGASLAGTETRSSF